MKSPKAWRLRLNLSLEQLSDLTGYSVIAIRKFEAGSRNAKHGEGHSEWVMQRYRMACSGAERQIKSGKEFSWRSSITV
jgi:transcriptional regulator with XRE-family HTH domain